MRQNEWMSERAGLAMLFVDNRQLEKSSAQLSKFNIGTEMHTFLSTTKTKTKRKKQQHVYKNIIYDNN